jgi:hypothetical protein
MSKRDLARGKRVVVEVEAEAEEADYEHSTEADIKSSKMTETNKYLAQQMDD